MTDTWDYRGVFEDSPILDEWVWERLRLRRDQLLAASDFRMVTDAPWDRAPWEAYRQALRDLPANTVDPRVTVWPEAPSE
jgi:hypothetical protein